jgi:hypothetical protein
VELLDFQTSEEDQKNKNDSIEAEYQVDRVVRAVLVIKGTSRLPAMTGRNIMKPVGKKNRKRGADPGVSMGETK